MRPDTTSRTSLDGKVTGWQTRSFSNALAISLGPQIRVIYA
jgi:hypothetical protein